MGDVLHLFTCLVHRFPMQQLSEVEVIKDKGFKGCIHGRPGSKRQVSLMDRETLDKLGVAPGIVKENVGHAKLSTTDLYFRSAGINMRGQMDGLRIAVPQDTEAKILPLKAVGSEPSEA